jgi:hypothetical protein
MTKTQRETRTLRRLSYVRIGEQVDSLTGLVYYPHSERVRGYVTVRWMKAHGYLPETLTIADKVPHEAGAR